VSNNTIKLKSLPVLSNECEHWLDRKLMKYHITSLKTLIISCHKNKLKMIDRTKKRIKSIKKQFEETFDLVFLPTHKKE